MQYHRCANSPSHGIALTSSPREPHMSPVSYNSNLHDTLSKDNKVISITHFIDHGQIGLDTYLLSYEQTVPYHTVIETTFTLLDSAVKPLIGVEVSNFGLQRGPSCTIGSLQFSTLSIDHDSSVGVQTLSRDIAAVLTRQEDKAGGHFAWLAWSTHRGVAE